MTELHLQLDNVFIKKLSFTSCIEYLCLGVFQNDIPQLSKIRLWFNELFLKNAVMNIEKLSGTYNFPEQ